MSTKEAIDKAVEVIKNSNLFKNHAWKSHWISGSSTVVYPITVWHPNKEIVIQMDREKYRGRTRAIQKLVKELSGIPSFEVTDWHYTKNDGSCPPELYIWYKEI